METRSQFLLTDRHVCWCHIWICLWISIVVIDRALISIPSSGGPMSVTVLSPSLSAPSSSCSTSSKAGGNINDCDEGSKVHQYKVYIKYDMQYLACWVICLLLHRSVRGDLDMARPRRENLPPMYPSGAVDWETFGWYGTGSKCVGTGALSGYHFMEVSQVGNEQK